VARPYKHPREFLDDALALVFQLMARQITVYTEVGFLPKHTDEFSGTFVSFKDVRTLLDGGKPPAEDAVKRVAQIDAALAADAEHIEGRLAASRAEGKPIPLDAMRDAFGLSPTEFRALLVVLAVEVNQRARALMRYLVNDAARVHPDVGLLDHLVYTAPTAREALIRELALDGPLFRYRLLDTPGRKDEPFLLRSLRVAPRVIEAAHGVMRLDPEVGGFATLIADPRGWEQLELPARLKDEVVALLDDALMAARLGERRPIVLLHGAEGSGRRSLAFGGAHALNLGVVRVRCADLPREPNELARAAQALARETLLYRALLVLDGVDQLAPEIETGRPDRARILDAAVLDRYPGPVIATAPRSDSRPVQFGRGLVTIEVPALPESVRAKLWARALHGTATQNDVDRAAARYPVSGGVILAAADSAMTRARARGDQVSAEDLHAGLRSTLDVKMSALGVRLTWSQTWDDLVLPEESLDEIKEFIARVRHKRRVYEEWGFARKVAKGLGLSALFSGPPGTGKTMVAGIIADDLALDLYQVDLSRIVSKYVGETEKNLASLFDAAEAGHAIILFDEADSLFARRTEVKSSVDRYANLEVNYLLQRMEQFSGITILTTNLDSSIDEAFRRRLSFRVDFPMPEPPEREKLWRAMIPTQAQVARDIDWKSLAQRYAMTGGYIKNAVVRAAFMAAEESSAIAMRHLARAANLEYAAMGKVMVAR
jgi:ATP-dependent 26S proteasome regulatory subunit